MADQWFCGDCGFLRGRREVPPVSNLCPACGGEFTWVLRHECPCGAVWDDDAPHVQEVETQ